MVGFYISKCFFYKTQYISALLSTLDDRLQYPVSDFKKSKTKVEALAVIDAAMELRFPMHNRRIEALAENKKLIKKYVHMLKYF